MVTLHSGPPIENDAANICFKRRYDDYFHVAFVVNTTNRRLAVSIVAGVRSYKRRGMSLVYLFFPNRHPVCCLRGLEAML